MSHLILIRHSQSQRDPTRSASRWGLTPEGRRRCVPLAEKLRAFQPHVVVASREPKASETGELVAAQLHVSFEQADGLHEHAREHVAYLSDAEFDRTVCDFFSRPDELVFGEETGNEARERFEQAVWNVLNRYSGRNVAIVAHGTVITLFVVHHAGVEPITFWKSLGMPAFVVVSLPDFQLQHVVERIEENVSGNK